ncbi:MAG: hypothetical protein IJH50_08665 [Kiritimatiellae bacterium]|nr:hypothetical protein [Kiritimatiellia bacterium]
MRFALVGAASLFTLWLALVCRVRLARMADTLSKIPRAHVMVFLGFVAIVTVCAQKPAGTNAPPQGVSHTDVVQQSPRSSGELEQEVTNLCFTAITVSSNSVTLSLAWPTNLFTDGGHIDFFAKTNSLFGRWEWIGCQAVEAADTNLTVTLLSGDFAEVTNIPSAAFFSMRDRASDAATMRDWDGDGIPDVYELNNGANPYLPDAMSTPRLTVGDGCDFADLADALNASEPYSVIELSAGEHQLWDWIVMPKHPVLLTGPDGGYAVIRSKASIAAVLIDGGQTCEMMFRNMILVLERKGNFQAGFWVGGNLPWSGVGASPMFENVRIRAPNPDTLYYGWHYYRDDSGTSIVSNCVMNSAGATWVTGVYSYGGPEVVVADCDFVNFSVTNGNYVTYFRSGANIVAECVAPESGLSWAGYPLDGEYSMAKDSDGDGLSDYDEIFVQNTDPWLSDSDCDGVTDSQEVDEGTDPCSIVSFLRHVTVVVTADDTLAGVTNYVAWGVAAHGWETNSMAMFSGPQGSNEFLVANSSEDVYAKAYRDMNRNGIYDQGADILLVQAIPASATPCIRLAFGDVDGDGVSDIQERLDGTDPYDAGNFHLVCIVVFFNSDGAASVTNYGACGMDAGWTSAGAVAFVETVVVDVDEVVTNGFTYAKCLRDFNADGEHSEGDDVLYVFKLMRTDNGKTVTVAIGDRDGDGLQDGEEIADETDPENALNYCLNLTLVEKGVFSTTNSLTVEIKADGQTVYGPELATNRTWEADAGHVVVTNGGIYAYFWDDANSNGVRDTEEVYVSQRLIPNGHDNSITNTLPKGMFDRDGDGILDWWEVLHVDAGLSPINAADAWLDPDGDGLINLHEYWADCNPFVPDGSNTVLSVMARSVDDRLTMSSTGRIMKFSDNLYGYTLNTNCWAYGIDTSCASPRNSWYGSCKAGTAVTRRHIVLANHYPLRIGDHLSFLGTNDVSYSRTIIATSRVADTDIFVCLLGSDLPESVNPAKLLPQNYQNYIGTGRGIPGLMFDCCERAIVSEFGVLPKTGGRS